MKAALVITVVVGLCFTTYLFAGLSASRKPPIKESWAKKYHIYKPQKEYEKNVFRVINKIAPECGVKEITTKRILVFINEILTKRDKAALMNCPYDLQKPLEYFLTEYAPQFTQDSDNSLPVLLAWTLRHMIHSKYPDEATKKKYRDELKEFLGVVFAEVKASLKKKLKNEYKANEKAIDKQIREYKDLICYKYKVLQSDPFFPAFKDSPIAEKVAVDYIKEQAQTLNSYPDNISGLKETGGALGLRIEGKVSICIRRIGNKILSAIASVPIDEKCEAETSYRLYPYIGTASTKKYWPVRISISLHPEQLKKMKTGNVARINEYYLRASKDLNITTSGSNNKIPEPTGDPRQPSGFNYVEKQ